MAPTAEPPSSPPPLPPRCPRTGPPPGLKNLGNTCYLNSVLQCLASTPPLATFCLASRHSNLCKKVFPNRDKECAFCLLERQIARLLRADAGMLDSPGKFIRGMPLFAEHFRWGRQEDAHEFLRYVVDACHTAGLRMRKRLPGASANGDRSEEGRGPGSCMVMRETFGGALLSQVKCLVCKGESNKTDEIMDLSLDLPGSSSVADALARFFQPEILEGANKYSCERRQIFLGVRHRHAKIREEEEKKNRRKRRRRTRRRWLEQGWKWSKRAVAAGVLRRVAAHSCVPRGRRRHRAEERGAAAGGGRRSEGPAAASGGGSSGGGGIGQRLARRELMGSLCGSVGLSLCCDLDVDVCGLGHCYCAGLFASVFSFFFVVFSFCLLLPATILLFLSAVRRCLVRLGIRALVARHSSPYRLKNHVYI